MYQYDSRLIQPGDTFIVLPGGEPFIETAMAAGAAAHIAMSREEMAVFADNYFGHPSQSLCVIGVTGTSGKTTLAYLVNQCLNALGYSSQYLGTINSALTTPESLDIQRLMAEHRDNGGTHFVMEVSSHGIAQGRISALQFAVKALTNITHDHLDFHKTLEAYRETKLAFMRDQDCHKIMPETWQRIQLPFTPQLLGDFNYQNLQCAYAVLAALAIPEADITRVLGVATAPPGRFEAVHAGQDFHVVVDYAHKPDGLEKVLQTARKIVAPDQGRIITVFGCGGNRDRGKRPIMAEIALRHSDFVVITQDNPRTENPDQIMADILTGIGKNTHYTVIQDRREAIRSAIRQARPNDLVMIAGKGHETYQITGTETIHFDDREEAVNAIREAPIARLH